MNTEANTTDDTPAFKPQPQTRPHRGGKHSQQQHHKVLARLRGDHPNTSRYLALAQARINRAALLRAVSLARCSAQAEKVAREKWGDGRRDDLEAALEFKGEPGVLIMFPHGI